MSDRESTLSGLGICLSDNSATTFASVTPALSDIPLLSGYSEFTPIRIVSSDLKAGNAHVEPDKPRD
jgi:hypothetical protein